MEGSSSSSPNPSDPHNAEDKELKNISLSSTVNDDDDDDDDFDEDELLKNSIDFRFASAVVTTEDVKREEARARSEEQNSPRRSLNLNEAPEVDDEWDMPELECCVCRDGSPDFKQRDDLTFDERMQYQFHSIGQCAGKLKALCDEIDAPEELDVQKLEEARGKAAQEEKTWASGDITDAMHRNMKRGCADLILMEKQMNDKRGRPEHDQAKTALAAQQQKYNTYLFGKRAAENDGSSSDEKKFPMGLSDDIRKKLQDFGDDLKQQRKKWQISSTLAPIESFKKYAQISSHLLHESNNPGILSVDIHPSKDIIATGGIDSHVVLSHPTSGQKLSLLVGHSKKVNSVKFVSQHGMILSGSADKSVRVWKGKEDGNYECQHNIEHYTAAVQAIAIHATSNYFVTAFRDNSWGFYDILSGLCLSKVRDEDTMGYRSASFHPYGHIFGTGTSEALVKIWDARSQLNVAKLDGHTGSVTAMSFSENGYLLATAAHDGVRLWDLRKLDELQLTNFLTIAPDSDVPTNVVEFDHSGRYLAMAGSDVRVYQVAEVEQEWNCLNNFRDLTGQGKTCMKFGPDAKYMALGSMDGKLHILGLPPD